MINKKVLITGGAGYLGCILTRHLLNKGNKVTCLDNLMYGQQRSILEFADNPDFEFVYGDVRDKKIVEEALKDKDVIFPLAAIVGMPACDKKKHDAVSTNLESIIMLNEIREKGQVLIYPTTNSGYGTQSDEIYCTEETPLKPISLYGETKVAAEKALLESEKGAITLRLATVFGLSPRMRIDLLVNDFVWKAVNDRYIILFEPHFKRNFIHIKDVARAFEHAADNYEKMKGKSYNTGLDAANMSKRELAEKIKEYIPEFVIMESAIGKDPDKRNYIVSSKRLYDTGFFPIYSLDDGIKELIKAYSILKVNQPNKNV